MCDSIVCLFQYVLFITLLNLHNNNKRSLANILTKWTTRFFPTHHLYHQPADAPIPASHSGSYQSSIGFGLVGKATGRRAITKGNGLCAFTAVSRPDSEPSMYESSWRQRCHVVSESIKVLPIKKDRDDINWTGRWMRETTCVVSLSIHWIVFRILNFIVIVNNTS